MRNIVSAVLITGALWANAASAQEVSNFTTAVAPATKAQPSVEQLSADEQMVVVVRNDAGEKFTQIDADGNDEISREEYIEYSLRKQNEQKDKGELDDNSVYDANFYSMMFNELDSNGEGKVTRMEYIDKQVKDMLGDFADATPAVVEEPEISAAEQKLEEQRRLEEERIRQEEERVRREEERIRKEEEAAREQEEEIMRMKEEWAANDDGGYEVKRRRR